MKSYFVYIMTNHARTLYVGGTNDLQRRVYEHKTNATSGFTATYNVDQLAYFEEFTNVNETIAAE